MGYIKHNAIIVTSWKAEALVDAADKAAQLGMAVAGPAQSAVNGYWHFMVCPDGSKEGWEDSHIGDTRRDQLVAYLSSVRYEDGSSCLEWVEVAYGSDDEAASIVRHGCAIDAAREVE